MNAAKRILIILLMLIALAGIGCALYPTANNQLWKYQTEKAAESFLTKSEILPDIAEAIQAVCEEA